jgi:hypothetical protein
MDHGDMLVNHCPATLAGFGLARAHAPGYSDGWELAAMRLKCRGGRAALTDRSSRRWGGCGCPAMRSRGGSNRSSLRQGLEHIGRELRARKVVVRHRWGLIAFYRVGRGGRQPDKGGVWRRMMVDFKSHRDSMGTKGEAETGRRRFGGKEDGVTVDFTMHRRAAWSAWRSKGQPVGVGRRCD